MLLDRLECLDRAVAATTKQSHIKAKTIFQRIFHFLLFFNFCVSSKICNSSGDIGRCDSCISIVATASIGTCDAG